MKRLVFMSSLLFWVLLSPAQVGIGTLSPNTKSVLDLTSNTKGLLLPRMTSAERIAFGQTLTSSEAGMMVYQTTAPKGPYAWDGTNWIYYITVDPGSTTSTTLRWDNTNSKWIPATNLYNGGGSIGINTNSLNYQLQVHSVGASSKFQITTAATGTTALDGLVLGVSNSIAQLSYLENKAMWFGTNSLERVRIDSIGRIGINTQNPASLLQVNGSADNNLQLQLTNPSTSTLGTDGLLIGVNGTGNAIVNQQENRPMSFATNNIERVRLDSLGRLGINTSSPSSTLDVNGTFKLGTSGSQLQSIIRMDVEIDPPPLVPNAEWIAPITCPNTLTSAVVYASPAINIDHMMIGNSRVSSPGNLEVKFMNMSQQVNDPGPLTLHIVIIQ